MEFANTGVKNLHPLAQKFDIGVYFEANGHGTVLFSNRALELIASNTPSEGSTEPAGVTVRKLAAFSNLINQAVGDAIADLLVVEAVLVSRGWTMQQWDQNYTDLPNRLAKVKVTDRTIFETTDAERRLVSPHGLQGSVDSLVAKYSKGRSFVRPSGTEDVVRVYAEAETRQMADLLAHEVSCLVFNEAGGVGERPKLH